MDGRYRTLELYGRPSELDPLRWSWVDGQLAAAGPFWVVPVGGPVPHPCPVWGLWAQGRLHLSIGSPTIARRTGPGSPVTVHLESGTDVVIVEGEVEGQTTDPEVIRGYRTKYGSPYDVDEHGPLTTVAPRRVLAWRTAGWAGTGSFQRTGCWTFP